MVTSLHNPALLVVYIKYDSSETKTREGAFELDGDWGALRREMD